MFNIISDERKYLCKVNVKCINWSRSIIEESFFGIANARIRKKNGITLEYPSQKDRLLLCTHEAYLIYALYKCTNYNPWVLSVNGIEYSYCTVANRMPKPYTACRASSGRTEVGNQWRNASIKLIFSRVRSIRYALSFPQWSGQTRGQLIKGAPRTSQPIRLSPHTMWSFLYTFQFPA